MRISSRFNGFIGVIAIGVLAMAGTISPVEAKHDAVVFAVTMTNDPTVNAIKVYDADTNALVQTLSTEGRGGVAGNARGVKQYQGEIVAAVNNGSNSVAIFRRDGNTLKFDRLIATTSAPVSIDFGNHHMYVAGVTTVDSFELHDHVVGRLDGTTALVLANGGVPAAGSTAQVGVVDDTRLLVTLKTDPDPGTVDVIDLEDGAIAGAAPRAVSAPAGTLTPFGFSVYPDATAIITLAHSNHDGLFRNGAFVSVISAGQNAPCWSTRIGKYVFTANTGSRTLSRLVGTGNHIFVDASMAASIVTGGAPSDIDGAGGFIGVIDRGAGSAHVSLFKYNRFGELTVSGVPITIGAAGANGIAIVPGADRD